MSNQNSDKILKTVVGNLLKKTCINTGGYQLPILSKLTSQIVINCNDGEIADIKPTYRIK